ncbi:MAG: RHS repeat-associated core domain-containing protein [Prevotellaceae bacterium]|jgi:RHS repeat-associated protein|nr:RHS repeat-associated core domain-containing protein [Prevotellaceae bacterium]
MAKRIITRIGDVFCADIENQHKRFFPCFTINISYDFDAWGRPTAVDYPDGTTDSSTYSWESGTGRYSITGSSTGKPSERTYYDAAGREVRTGNQRFDGSWQYVDKQYDGYGRLWKESLPFKGSSASLWNEYEYDSYDRVTTLTEASGKETGYAFNNRIETTTKDGITFIRSYDATHTLRYSHDPAGVTIYNYRPDGQLSSIVAPGNITTTFGYNSYGHRTSLEDPSAGTITSTDVYNNSGIRTTSQTDAEGNTVTVVYDVYGRPTSQTTEEFTTSYTYDATTKNIAHETSTNGTSRHYTYDSYGRLRTHKEVSQASPDSIWLKSTYTYSNGNVSSIAYHSSREGSIGTENRVYANGNLKEIKWGTTSIRNLTAENAFGQPTTVVTGPLTRTYGYTTYGIPTMRKAQVSSTNVWQHFTYTFNTQTNNLTSRVDQTRSLTESFTYDNLNRLTGYGGKTVSYDSKGNITAMSGVGSFTYGEEAGAYALTGATPTGTLIPERDQAITYNSQQRPLTIAEDGYTATFTYNADGDRVKMLLQQGTATQNTTYYIGGNYETNNGSSRLYLAGDYYSAPVVLVKQGSGSWSLYYICRDYLGSITHVTNASGTLQQELSYDAWGRLRNPANQTVYAPDAQPTLFLGRGFTGHEHLPLFGLINMNARLYDPALGRFLSPDPYVQMPDFSQSFNRYAYALNNPLVYTDESGEFISGFLSGLIKGIVTGKNILRTAWESGINEVKIALGLFKGSFKQIISRFTWESFQTLFGYLWAQTSNLAGQVDKVDYWGGATVVSGNNWEQVALTLGNFIVGNRSLEADPGNKLFQHEYGHYLQSQAWGPLYMAKVAIPSLIDTEFGGHHGSFPVEIDANVKAFKYFSTHVSRFNKRTKDSNGREIWESRWDFSYNQIPLYDETKPYNSTQNQAALRMHSLSIIPLDLFSFSPIVGGLINSLYYNMIKY